MSKRTRTKKKPQGPEKRLVDNEEHRALQEVCVILTKSITGMLYDANIAIDFALVVRRNDKNGGRMSAVGSSMEHSEAAQTLSDILKGLRKAASH